MALPTPPLQIINNGNFVDDPTAETVYASFQKSKLNFAAHRLLLEYQGYEKIFLSLSGIDTTGNELEYIAEAIERGKYVGGSYGTPFTVSKIGRAPLFYVATPTGSGYNSGFDYRYYRVHKKGQVFGGSGGVFITSSDVSPAGSFSIGSASEPTNSDNYIELGNIGSSDVWTVFNQGKPAPNLGEPWFVEGLTLVTATQNGANKTWSFTGNQKLDINNGNWGGSNVTDPNYLAAISDYFDLLSNQPIIYPDLFITKSSKKFREVTLSSAVSVTVPLSPESSTFNVNVTGGVGEIKGFVSLTLPPTYDGMDIYFRNSGVNDLKLLHNGSGIRFNFKTASDLVLKTGDIVHLKYNAAIGSVELVGISDVTNSPVPFGQLRILKIAANSNANAIEAGDRVVSSNLNDDIFLSMGVYVSGDVMELSSYEPISVDYYDPNA